MSKINQQQAEQILYKNYYNKFVSFEYPGYPIIYGKVDNIGIEVIDSPLVVIQINNIRYTCSPESLKQCLKLLK